LENLLMKNETESLRRQVEDLKTEVIRLQERESEELYRSFFENNHAVMLLIDPENAAIKDANPAACTYYGWSREELKKLRIDEINTLTREEVFAQMQLARSEKRRNFFFKHRRADGGIRDVEVYSGPLTVKGKALLYSIIHDITDRMQAQELLAESERRLSTLMANLPGMAYRCLNDESWTMKFVSEGCFDLTGFLSDNLLENRRISYAELIHPNDRQMVWEQVQRSIEGRSQFNLTYRIHTANGQEKWVMEIGQGVFSDTWDLLAIEGFITDITESKRAEDALRQSEEKFRLAFHTSPDSINFNRLSDGMYIDINESFTKLTGYTREEAIGKTSIDLNIWADPKDRGTLVKALKSEGHVENLEARFWRKNGQVSLGLMSARVLRLNEEEVILSITRDITLRKRAEDALRESEDKYIQLVESLTDAILVWSSEDIIYANPAALKLFRVNQARDLIGKRYLDFVHSDDRPESAERIKKSKNEKWIAPRREHRMITADGKVIHVESTGVPIQFQGKIQHFGIFSDITERVKAEEALRESEERYRTLIENIPQGVLLKNRESKYISINTAYALAFGLRQEDIIGKSDYDFHPKDSADKFRQEDRLVMEAGESREFDEENVKDGKKRFYHKVKVPVRDGMGKIIGVLSTLTDISERRQAEEAFHDSEERHRRIVEALSDAILLRSKGIVIYANPAALKLFRANYPGDLIGKRYLDLVHPDDRALSAERVKKNIDENWIASPREHRVLALDGQVVHVESTGVPVKYRGETQVFGVFRDIAERKRTDEEKEKLEGQLQQAQKMEAIGSLAGGIAHDFNNILSAIIGYTELAMLNKGTSNSGNELNQALIAATRAKDLVKQILAFSRQTDEERMPVSVGIVVKEAIKFLRATIPTTIEIKSRIDEKSGAVLANSVELHQIIMNLCTNSVHAIGDRGGVLEVEVRNTEIEHAQKNNFIGLETGSYVLVSVKDTGYGMTPDVIERIFDPYFTTKEKGVGTGLGLAVVHGIVKKSGGAIKVGSEPGKGTTFHIYFPKVDMTAPIKAEQPQIIVGGSERILFVDDEKMVADIGQQVLQRLGYDVVSRTSPIEALELFKAKPDFFDLVITDQTMPGMTGDALVKELLSIRPNLPVIICTGYSQTIDHERAKQKGIKAFVMKPLLINEIAAAVRKVLDNE
jgi:PAS domain S-box-containing protein